MGYRLVFNTEVATDLKEARDWYEAQKYGLGDSFEMQLGYQLQRIVANPLAYHFSRGHYREAVMRKFPFSVVYKVNARKQVIYISAIHHTSRNPSGKYRK